MPGAPVPGLLPRYMRKRLLAALAPLSLFVLVFGFKLDVVHRFGSDLPRWDQFDAEGLAVFVPLAEGRLGPLDLLTPHNEHRIVWTKLLGLAGLKANGQWDARLQCVANAALHSAIAVLLFVFARGGLPRVTHGPAFLLIALLFAVPLAWENPIAGFHSQQYFLVGFSVAAIWLLPLARPGGIRWWTGVGCMVAALGTMGSGLLAGATVIAILAVRAGIRRDLQGTLTGHWPTILAAGLVVALGAASRVTVSYHDELMAGSVADFVRFTVHCLQWPARSWSWLAIIIWMPTALLAWRLARRKEPEPGEFPLVLLGLAGWVLLQVLATAYTRGADGGMPASRYADTLAFGLLVNGLILFWLGPQVRPGLLRWGFGAAWTLAVLLPGASLAATIYRVDLPGNRRHLEACEENVRQYLATEDSRHLVEPDVPYPSARSLKERIDLPVIRRILPVSVRPALTLEATGDHGPFLLQDNIRPARKYVAPPRPFPPELASLPPLPSRKVWFSDPAAGAGVWSGVPLVFKESRVLRFLVAGRGDARLVLRNAASGDPLAVVNAATLSATAWRIVHVPVRSGMVRLTAESGADGAWLAFSEPVEMAPGSYASWRLVRIGNLIGLAGGGLALLAAFASWYCARTGKTLG